LPRNLFEHGPSSAPVPIKAPRPLLAQVGFSACAQSPFRHGSSSDPVPRNFLGGALRAPRTLLPNTGSSSEPVPRTSGGPSEPPDPFCLKRVPLQNPCPGDRGALRAPRPHLPKRGSSSEPLPRRSGSPLGSPTPFAYNGLLFGALAQQLRGGPTPPPPPFLSPLVFLLLGPSRGYSSFVEPVALWPSPSRGS